MTIETNCSVDLLSIKTKLREVSIQCKEFGLIHLYPSDAQGGHVVFKFDKMLWKKIEGDDYYWDKKIIQRCED